MDNDLKLPEGKTCQDCVLFRRCASFVGRRGPETECDFDPPAFAERADQ